MPNKINTDKVSGFSPIRTTGQSEVKKSGGETAKPIAVSNLNSEDKLEFSNRGTEVGKFVEQVKDMADLRQDKVNQLREQVSSGNYNPSSEDIADAILKDESI